MMDCWFCGEALHQPGRLCDRHHVLPKRYLTTPEKHDPGNIALVHQDCHTVWHRLHDPQKLNREQYERFMEKTNWGKGILAAQPLAAD